MRWTNPIKSVKQLPVMRLKSFYKYVVELLGVEYLKRIPSEEERFEIMELNKKRGFPGMFASWDCKHFKWQKCPTRLSGQHKGKDGKTLVLEAISDGFLFIWRSFFGEPGSLNDINILDKSTIIQKILQEQFNIQVPSYTINGTSRNYMYFLVDGIYPKYAIFASSINIACTEEEDTYKKKHEHVRKDIERAFGVLVKSKGILSRPFRNWIVHDIVSILNACIILHNMTVEYRKTHFLFQNFLEFEGNDNDECNPVSLFGETGEDIASRVANLNDKMEDYHKNRNIQSNLMAHLNSIIN